MKSGQVGYVLIALIALAIAGVIVRLVSAGGGDETLGGLLPIQRDVIDRVTIRSTETEARLVRRGEAWTVGTHPAFEPKLEQMWDVVDRFEGAQLVSSNPANHERMGVDPRQGVEVIFFLGQAIQERFTIGRWSPDVRQCFLRRGSEDLVYAVNCQFEDLFDPDPDGWRNPVIVSVPPEALDRVTIRFPSQGDDFFEIDATGQFPMLMLPEGPQPANPYAAEALLRALSVLVAEGFASDEEAAGIDFDVPDASVLVKPREGSQIPTQRILFVRREDGHYYAKNTARADVFVVAGPVVESFVLPLDSYLIPEDALPVSP